ncbi:MAG: 1-acyl-sn-glycerol-3-phosphate acyltransferase [Deltaproteobacteria bacterium]|nr:1-acyl-sn-glycerol-3-phosphate acyltransferase [Deltaproteobacteria bacterium]MBW2388734.1 1-acyl-sn-glycerol-3-phosphate acyltransferase [Deltaproteobacteria bacterium]MBW2723984.1 1-acyl-sn-glycerol-3-phosphate acyltransferase [Deltaproteobacteria bacterium]
MPAAAVEKLEPLREALSGLLEEIRSQQRRALEPRRESSAGIEWDSLFDELRRRVGTLGMVEREPAVDDFGMQADFVERLEPLLDFLYERYWRVDFVGQESLPSKGPVLYVANRSGVLSWDGMMLSHAIDRSTPQLGRPRFLVEDALLQLPFAQAQLARVGGVRACRENVEQLISRGHSVIAFPEGARAASRSFRERYQVGHFGSGDEIAAAIEARVRVVPVGIVGAEEAYPRLGDLATLSKLISRELRLPALPITPIFPLLGPLGLLPLPSKWVIAVGKPISPPDLERLVAAEGLASSQPSEVLREEVQRLVEQALDARSSIWN